MIDSRLRHQVQPVFDSLGKRLHQSGFTPGQITMTAFITGILSAIFISQQWIILALVFLWLSGVLDLLDGTVARLSGSITNIGALFDLILDRMVEAAVIIGFYMMAPGDALAYLLFLTGVIFNFSTFLAAGTLFTNTGFKSMHYDAGILERTETFLLFTVMILWPAGRYGLLMAFNIVMFITGFVRLIRLIKQTNQSKDDFEE